MLESRAGTPAWGPELLARHYLVGIEANLDSFYGDWETWSADVARVTPPTRLCSTCGPPSHHSWLVGLVAVLDSAALYLSLCPSAAPAEARLCVRMGFTCLRDIARAIRIPFDPDPRRMPTSSCPSLISSTRWPDCNRPASPRAQRRRGVGPFQGVADQLRVDRLLAGRHHVRPPGPWTGQRRYPDAADTPMFPSRPVDRRPDRPKATGSTRPDAAADRRCVRPAVHRRCRSNAR